MRMIMVDKNIIQENEYNKVNQRHRNLIWNIKIDISIFCPKVCKMRIIFSGFAVTIDFNIRLKTNSWFQQVHSGIINTFWNFDFI